MANIIEIKNLKKYFDKIKAVDDISFEVREGEFFAFLGQNGAGKSTTINILCGDLIKNSGNVIINGFDIDKDFNAIKPLLGVVYQESVLDKQLTVKDNLICRASLYGIKGNQLNERLDILDQLFHIKELYKRPICKLSGGQKRRVDISRALIHNPKILILDEPTTGLDPLTRNIVWNAINKVRKEFNTTVFLTTHYMEETANADYIVIIDNGKISAQGTPLDLKNKYTGDFITFYNTKEEDIKKLKLPYKKIKNTIKVEVKSLEEAKNLLIAHPQLFNDYEITKGKMDDVFLNVTGKDIMEEK